MAISDWPVQERPREKLLQLGAEALSDAELLAIFLRTGVAGKTAVDLARELLIQFGGLRPLLEADMQAFCSGHGLGQAKYVLLQAVLEIAKRHLRETLERGDTLNNPNQTQEYLIRQLRHRGQEIFACLYLDNRHRIIRFSELFKGTINGATVHPREILKEALKFNAAAVILCHNHPSGVAEPSQADLMLTEKLRQTLELVDVRVLDHIIIGDGEVASLAQRGLL